MRGQIDDTGSVKETIGAGDTFNVGFLAMLDKGNVLTKAEIANISTAVLRAALEHGVKDAAIVVQRE